MEDKYGALRFCRVKAPTGDELSKLAHTIAHRVDRYLERGGLLERDADTTWLTQEAVYSSEEDPSNHLLGSSITYQIAVGPKQGRKVMTLQSLPDGGDDPFTTGVAARRGNRKKCHSVDDVEQTPAEKRASMTWTRRLKRVFHIDIETCSECEGDVRIIASIEDPAVIRTILAYLDKKGK